MDCYCLFNNLAPQTLSSYISSQITAANANPALAGVAPASSGTATLVSTGAALSPNSYVASLGFWIVQKQIQSFTDDLRFTFDLFPGDKLTVGGYLATYSSDDHWWLGNNELITGTQNAQLVDLTLNNGVNVTNPAGQLSAAFLRSTRTGTAATRRCSPPINGSSTSGCSMPATASNSRWTTAPSKMIPAPISTPIRCISTTRASAYPTAPSTKASIATRPAARSAPSTTTPSARGA